MLNGKRNYCMDFVKGILCMCVVVTHCMFPGYLGIIIKDIIRLTVPFFLMVSGYFCYKEGGKTDYLKKIKHIGYITLCASVFYLIVTPLYQKESISISLTSILKLAIFNKPTYLASPLWFLFALLYDYILFALLEKLNLRKLAYLAIPIGFLVHISMAQGLYILGHALPSICYRNFLIYGFPFFSLGFYIHEKQNHVQISNKILIAGLIISTLLCPVERNLMGKSFPINFVSYVQSICLFIFAVKNPEIGKGKMLNKLGTKYSLYIYVLHAAIWHILDNLYAFLGIDANKIFIYIRPIICVIVSVAVSVLYVYVFEVIKNRISVRVKGQ